MKVQTKEATANVNDELMVNIDFLDNEEVISITPDRYNEILDEIAELITDSIDWIGCEDVEVECDQIIEEVNCLNKNYRIDLTSREYSHLTYQIKYKIDGELNEYEESGYMEYTKFEPYYSYIGMKDINLQNFLNYFREELTELKDAPNVINLNWIDGDRDLQIWE